jgi:hypothetical protein
LRPLPIDVRALLGETFRLFGGHLHLFTLISLTVWLPGHVVRNYLEFFGSPEESATQSLGLVLMIQAMFDPLVVSSTLVALARIKQGLPVSYGIAITEGMAAWGRLFVVRFIINCAVALPVLGGLGIRPSAPWGLVAASVLLGIAFVFLALLVRFAVVDSVVVLERGNAMTAWRRASQLTAGRRWVILWTATSLFVVVLGFALLCGQAFKVAPDLNHFVARVLVDCALAVSQSLFTVAFFLVYWRARVATTAVPTTAS